MDGRNLYALVLGVSSGFGKACASELAGAGYNIYGVHLDMGSGRKTAEAFKQELTEMGVTAKFYNGNAADDIFRMRIIDEIKSDNANDPDHFLRVVIHSLAFGAIGPLLDPAREKISARKQIEMTLDVMANSLVYWVQDLFCENLLKENARIFALTSIGSHRAIRGYGAISAAKAALEAYIRQIATELAPYKITANAIMAGLTDSPASRKIPGFDKMLEFAREHNPFRRNTIPNDVALAVSLLTDEKLYWLTGQTIAVDGGESIMNFIETNE